eukprot:EG_transcript_22929
MAGSYWLTRWKNIVGREEQQPGDQRPRTDPAHNRFPYAIVWTPIHPITWVLPFVGHMGIADSRGIIMDFTGMIGVDQMAFGNPTRYIVLDPKQCRVSPTPPSEADAEQDDTAAIWDDGLLRANQTFEDHMHCMVVGHDCHSHVAEALNNLKYRNCTSWNKVLLAAWIFVCGRHVGLRGFLLTWLPFLVLLCTALFFFL